MDLSEDVRTAHKRTFLKFFEQTVSLKISSNYCIYLYLILHIVYWLLTSEHQFQEYNMELKKTLELMVTQNRRRCIVNLSHFYHNREGTDLARR